MTRTKTQNRRLSGRSLRALGLAVLLVVVGTTILAGRAEAWTGSSGTVIAAAGGMRLQAVVGAVLPSQLRHVLQAGAVGIGATDPKGLTTERGPYPATRIQSVCPNPFNPMTAITYTVGRETRVTLTIVSATGAQVRRLLDATVGPEAPHTVFWDGRADDGVPVGSGVYFCHLAAGGEATTKKIMLLK